MIIPALKKIARGLSYGLALMGASVGGFPPPKLYAREEQPEEVIERVMEDSELDSLDGWQSEWGLRVETAPRRHARIPESPPSRRR